ncbi:hypothetical protein QU38_02075 [Staphylococcus aureus]|uniref:Uncharacterized protein n=1 Tax=Staphylococcus aureus TaxID=1280 RepID=A0AA40MKT8_STAAU|nr:hypothetical protein QU38_02075 [Staphylococcus aureus]
MGQEIGRGTVEIARSHVERAQDVLVDIDFEILAREALDHLAEIDDARVGIAEPAARFEL